MVGVPGTASDIFGSVRDAGVNVIMISQVRARQLFSCALASALLSHRSSGALALYLEEVRDC